MKLRRIALLVALSMSPLWVMSANDGKSDRLPRLPDATFLLGYPPYSLMATSGNATKILEEGPETDAPISPSISSDGKVIASAHLIPGDPYTRSPRLQVSTYSPADSKWTDLEGVEIYYGSVAISPDASKLAYIPHASRAPLPDSRIRIVSLKTGTTNETTEVSGRVGPVISWSPDSRRIVFEQWLDRAMTKSAIYIFDLETAHVSRIADGMSPSWSPSGESIAFVTYAGHSEWQVTLMHPDGSGSRVVRTFHADVFPMQPIWSPDSRALLLNEINPDAGTANVYLLNLDTLKITKRFKNVPPVFAWISAN